MSTSSKRSRDSSSSSPSPSSSSMPTAMYWETPVLTVALMKKLDKHEYNSSSESLLDPHMQHWWNFVVSQVPLWVAPNLITMVGLAVNIGTALILFFCCPTLTEPAPRWATFLCGLGLFFYQTLDAIDGKQARRTGTSSPMGELFDHGCDSVSNVFVVVSSACAVSLGYTPWLLLFQVMSAVSMFYLAHWAAFVTGKMLFGLIDVTEAQICIMSLFLTHTLMGPTFWEIELLGLFSLRIVPTFMALACALLSVVTTMDRICSGGAGKNGSTIAGTSVITPVIPLLMVIVPAITLAVKSEENVFESYPLLFVLTFGLIASKISNKLVVAHMSKSELSHLDVTLFVPLAFFVNAYMSLGVPEYYILLLSLAFVVVDLILYSRCVCLEICAHMGIELFRIVPNPPSSSQPQPTKK